VRELHGQFSHELHEHLVLLPQMRQFPKCGHGGNTLGDPAVDRGFMDAVLTGYLRDGDAVVLDALEDLLFHVVSNAVWFAHDLGGGTCLKCVQDMGYLPEREGLPEWLAFLDSNVFLWNAAQFLPCRFTSISIHSVRIS